MVQLEVAGRSVAAATIESLAENLVAHGDVRQSHARYRRLENPRGTDGHAPYFISARHDARVRRRAAVAANKCFTPGVLLLGRILQASERT